ncbi:MAG: HD domain-containing protein [Nitrosopumilus sp.]|nr:HD domain-containing protein [Nitrosopumilus sp.]
MKKDKKWTSSLLHYRYATGFFIALSFIFMIATGFFGIPLVSDFFSDKNSDSSQLIFAIFSLLGCVWGFMAYNQFDRVTKLVKKTWSLSHKLDPMIGEYDYKTFNPETRQWEEGYTHYGIVDYWERDNEVPQWMDKGKYWKILIELQKIDKDIILQITKDRNLPFNQGKNNLAITIKENYSFGMSKENMVHPNKYHRFRIVIPQWLVMNTDYKNFNTYFQLEISTLTNTITEVNKNIPKIIDELVGREKIILTKPWNMFISLVTYLNKSLPIRIIYGKTKEMLPDAKQRRIQYTNYNLSRMSTNDLIGSLIIKAKMTGIGEKSLNKISLLLKFLRNEYEKLGLGEGSSEYHNLHHSLEVAYMSLHMLPKEIHGYPINNRDYEIMLVAALLHDYDPMQDLKYRNSNYTRRPSVISTIEQLRKKRIHDAYFSFNDEGLIKYFRKNESPLLPTKEFSTVHPEHLNNRKTPLESKITEALIWRTDYPYDERSQSNFNQLLREINNNGFSGEKINVIAEILSLADLSVTYLSSDPLLAWNRVINLYQELNLPIAEAVLRTDRFLSFFSEESLFKEIISRKNFPEIFKQKWDNVYRFFHEGNPSTRINKIIFDARIKHNKINMELDMHNCDFIISNAIINKKEFFIGIGKNKEDVMIAQSKLKAAGIENLEVFPGNIESLLPFIKDRSVDTFIITITNDEKKDFNKTKLLRDLFYSYSSKLVINGTIQIIIGKDQDHENIISLIPNHEFKMTNISNNTISKDILNDEFIDLEKLEKVKKITILKTE